MNFAGRVALSLAVALLAALLFAACGGEESDPTDREITNEELSLMLLPQTDLGAEYAEFQIGEDAPAYESNKDLVAEAFDPEDEAQDIEKFGRVSGYGATYSRLQAQPGEDAPFALGLGVQLFADADGASGYAADTTAEVQQQVGQENEGAVLEEFTLIDVEKIGSETMAFHQKVVVEGTEGNQFTFYATFVGFREGRILGSVNVGRLDDQDISSEAAALARKLHDRILAVLAGEVTPTPTATPAGAATPTEPSTGIAPSEFLDSFHFTSDISVTVNGGVELNAEGDYQAPDRIACTIDGSIGGVTFARDEVFVIGDDAWLNVETGWLSTTTSDPDVQFDLDFCPGWAGYWSGLDFVAELGQLAGGERETVNGVPAIYYDTGSTLQEPGDLGLMVPGLEDMEVEVFDVWLAEDGLWPVAMEMIATGDAETLAEAMGLPPDEAGVGEGSLRMRVDISQVDSPSIRVEPPAEQ